MPKNSRLERLAISLAVAAGVMVVGLVGPLSRSAFMTAPGVRLLTLVVILAAVLAFFRPWRRLD